MTIKSINPHDYSINAEIESATEAEVKKAVTAAHQSKQSWKEMGVAKRVEILRIVYEKLLENKEAIAKHDTADMGFPITQCLNFNMGDAFSYFKWYLDNAEKYLSPEVTLENESEIHRVFYEPHGVAVVIQPWNFPFCQWSWSVVPTLLAGNTVLFKPSEEVVYANKFFEEIINSCNLPKGVLQFIYGDRETGDFLVHQDIDLIVFTGSTKTGQYLYQIAAEKFIPILLELGGSAPGIIFKDAHLETAIEGVFWQRFANCGQTCDGLKRLIVQEAVFSDVVEGLKAKLAESIIGDPAKEQTMFGPLSAKWQLEFLEEQVKDAINQGAEVITGGQRVKDQVGAYYQPTILTNIKPSMRVWQEEVFGPVLPIVSFKHEKEAVRLANDTQYGLGSYLYTQDIEKADRIAAQIEAGMVSVNATNYVLPMNPFGGYKKSGLGREHGRWGLRELTQIKVISRNKS